MHAGGKHEAVMAPAPTAAPLTLPTLPKTVLTAPAVGTCSATWLLELQVSGTPVMVIPRTSVTVAFRVVELPVLTTNDVAGFPNALSEIDCTGQVVNCSDWLFTALALANRKAAPGALAMADCWFKHCPCAPLAQPTLPAGSAASETALVERPAKAVACQVKGPTELVISVFPLKANAW